MYMQSEVEAAKNNEDAAKKYFKEAEADFERVSDSLPPEVILERAKALSANGQADKAKMILEGLANEYSDNSDLLCQIDNCLEEPVSKEGKGKMITFNKEGKKLFDAKNFKDAIDYFNRALQLYPNHMALNLNLAMAILKEIKESGNKEEVLVSRCQRIVSKLSDTPQDHKYYKLYNGVKKQVADL